MNCITDATAIGVRRGARCDLRAAGRVLLPGLGQRL